MLKTILLLGCGGFIGTVARYGTYLLMNRWFGAAFPWGTFVVNVLGSLFVGLVYGLFIKNMAEQQNVFLFLVVGILGGYTTFSAFALDNVQFLENGNYASFLLYSVLSFTLCIGSALLGYYIGK